MYKPNEPSAEAVREEHSLCLLWVEGEARLFKDLVTFDT